VKSLIVVPCPRSVVPLGSQLGVIAETLRELVCEVENMLEDLVGDLEDGFPVRLRVTVGAGRCLVLHGEGEHEVDIFTPFHLGTVDYSLCLRTLWLVLLSNNSDDCLPLESGRSGSFRRSC
jgi:hypothetical protein